MDALHDILKSSVRRIDSGIHFHSTCATKSSSFDVLAEGKANVFRQHSFPASSKRGLPVKVCYPETNLTASRIQEPLLKFRDLGSHQRPEESIPRCFSILISSYLESAIAARHKKTDPV